MPSFLDRIGAPTIDHDSSRASRWLQERWVSFGAAIAIAEGLFIVFGALSKWIAVGIAVVALVGYLQLDRSKLSPTLRIGVRILALSQLLVIFVPILIAFVYAAAIFALVVLAIVALAALIRSK